MSNQDFTKRYLPFNDLQSNLNKRNLVNNIFAIIGLLVITGAILILAALIIKMMIDGLPRLNWNFLFSFPSRKPEEAGILSAWVGTCLVMLVTTLVAVPLGVASGIYLEEYARKNWIADLIEINVTNLAGVPSIIYGLLALGFFVYQLNLGESILTAGLTLALLILPIVIVTTREALRSIPTNLREAAYALGASKWQMIWDHLLPYSFGTILTGIIIGLSRAIGETAPVITIGALTFIAFLPESPVKSEFPFISFSWLQAPFTLMPIQMFNWVSRPQKAFEINAAAAGTILTIMTLTINTLAIYLRYLVRKGIKW
ncbi:phosphate ABC transporter permease PstA [Okeania sp. SIO2B3]|uniref:phosphate ABC transporter permease PstA n=1 Tax=Okeania sp. SIO2B3 TaxID=2607784 RepID=UPI0013C031B8|nr:phosphate ABC transporter permease PstA [Okeania sp. SIO2B3]NET45717.1 phosphate ABC transporter permease PstA [Okeania sp. SIO2B3]